MLNNVTSKYLFSFQLLDLAGAAQTLEAHEAVMKYLSLNSEEDKCERYFWSLSLGSQPKLPVIKSRYWCII